ncbi:Arc family DNA-binding protein [Salmonella enterica]|uniref:Arc family DNA-binding protein n=1 Tax=Salmonella enterica TaxID=28901 RepID=UPI000FB25945|nr:Arc family DNA-binding protein [Salmonella enterica]EAA5545514.1 hypothetical protein [Salmonella enterica subsp. enterica serovar Abony]EBW5588358.1 hypothetical protein [Salmonella enterica subsp. enterica serovar Brandenburg]EBZ0660619.1 Arc family DNA-binding protein [Salmonella enterica subsp. enterica serovar Haifa]ECA2931823.1 Arc family DNA-binding protein [Salmonella enterica subsp. enterica serovar Saintpaul]ECD4288240.1 Arc family DNA-binding protein [Salmonella enterica subsp. e
MSREDAQMKIRLPADLKEQLENAANANGRSLNAEVLQRLTASFPTSTYDQGTHAFFYLRKAEGMGLGGEAEDLLEEWGKNIEKNNELLKSLHDLIENKIYKK